MTEIGIVRQLEAKFHALADVEIGKAKMAVSWEYRRIAFALGDAAMKMERLDG